MPTFPAAFGDDNLRHCGIFFNHLNLLYVRAFAARRTPKNIEKPVYPRWGVGRLVNYIIHLEKVNPIVAIAINVANNIVNTFHMIFITRVTLLFGNRFFTVRSKPIIIRL